MITKSITYTNFLDEEQTDQVHFNLTGAELIELETFYNPQGGLNGILEIVGKTKDTSLVVQTFKEILRRAYGIRTPDNRFVKPAAEWENFVASEAYSELMMGLIGDPDEASAFFSAIIHKTKEAQNRAQRRAQEKAKNEPAQGDRRPRPQDRRPKQQSRPQPSFVETEDPEVVEERLEVTPPEPEGTEQHVFDQYAVTPELKTSPAVVESEPIISSVTNEPLTQEQINNLSKEQLVAYYQRQLGNQ